MITIAIASVTAGGKTTAANELARRLSNANILHFDDYSFAGTVEDFHRWTLDGADYHAWNLQRLANDIVRIRDSGICDYLILDYPFAYRHAAIAKFIDLACFIDTPLDVALARRILRDMPDASGDDIRRDLQRYLGRARIAYAQMLADILPSSDCVIDGMLPTCDIAAEILHAIRQKRDGVELWDAYARDGRKMNRTLVRGEPIPNGVYHLVCEVLVCHADGSYLCMRRAQSKPNYPGCYEATAGGSALAGEDKWACIHRELLEETGIDCREFTEIGCTVDEASRELVCNSICTVDCPKDSIVLQPGETEGYRWMREDEFIDFIHSDQAINIQARRLQSLLLAMKFPK